MFAAAITGEDLRAVGEDLAVWWPQSPTATAGSTAAAGWRGLVAWAPIAWSSAWLDTRGVSRLHILSTTAAAPPSASVVDGSMSAACLAASALLEPTPAAEVPSVVREALTLWVAQLAEGNWDADASQTLTALLHAHT